MLQVVHRAGRGAQLRAVEISRLRQHVAERLPTFAQRVAALAFVGADLFFRHRQTHALRQIAHGLDEAQAQLFGQEADGVAAGPAAEAVIELLGRADRKAGRLFTVEGAQPHEVGAASLQFDVAADHLDDVDARDQFLQEAGWNHLPSLVGRSARTAPSKRPQASRCGAVFVGSAGASEKMPR